MVFVGIDVAKDKYDRFIVNSEGEALFDVFTVSNTMDGFNELLRKVKAVSNPSEKTHVGLETAGHYSYNLLGFLLDDPFMICFPNFHQRTLCYDF